MFPLALMNRLNKTQSAVFKLSLCRFSLFWNDLVFKIFLDYIDCAELLLF